MVTDEIEGISLIWRETPNTKEQVGFHKIKYQYVLWFLRCFLMKVDTIKHNQQWKFGDHFGTNIKQVDLHYVYF